MLFIIHAQLFTKVRQSNAEGIERYNKFILTHTFAHNMTRTVKTDAFCKRPQPCYGKRKARSSAIADIEDVVHERASLFRSEFARLLANIEPAKLQHEPTESQLQHARRFMYNFVGDSDALCVTSRKVALQYLEALETKLDIHANFMHAFRDQTYADSLLRVFEGFHEVYGATPKTCNSREKLYKKFKISIADLEDILGRSFYDATSSYESLTADKFVAYVFHYNSVDGVAYRQSLLHHLGYKFPFDANEQVERGQILKNEYTEKILSHKFTFECYVKLSSFLDGPPLIKLKNASIEYIFNKFVNGHSSCDDTIALRSLFTMTASLLNALDRTDVLRELQRKLHPKISGITYVTWFPAQSLWHQEFFDKLSDYVVQTHTETHFTSELCKERLSRHVHHLMFMTNYAEEKYNECLRIFIDTCTVKKMVDCALQSLADMETHNERVKNTHQGHHADSKTRLWIMLFKAMAEISPQCIDLSIVSTNDLICKVANKRVVSSEQGRRTFSNEEVEAMLEVVKHDAQLTLLMTILREVALRQGALMHLTYDRLVDELHTPRHVVTVPEKKLSWRCFVTSPVLKRAIKRYSENIRDKVSHKDKIFIFSHTDDCHLPPSKGWIPYVLKKISQEAGVTGVTVHPHAFRHTLVCELIKAGNSMEATSKYMGHKSVNVTATSYFVPTALQLQEQIKNPFDGTLQAELAEESDMKDKVQSLQSRLDKLAHFVHHQQSVFKKAAADELSAQAALTLFYKLTPNAEEILRHILMSSTLSTSSEGAG